jgi:hypothetical protein
MNTELEKLIYELKEKVETFEIRERNDENLSEVEFIII